MKVLRGIHTAISNWNELEKLTLCQRTFMPHPSTCPARPARTGGIATPCPPMNCRERPRTSSTRTSMRSSRSGCSEVLSGTARSREPSRDYGTVVDPPASPCSPSPRRIQRNLPAYDGRPIFPNKLDAEVTDLRCCWTRTELPAEIVLRQGPRPGLSFGRKEARSPMPAVDFNQIRARRFSTRSSRSTVSTAPGRAYAASSTHQRRHSETPHLLHPDSTMTQPPRLARLCTRREVVGLLVMRAVNSKDAEAAAIGNMTRSSCRPKHPEGRPQAPK